VGILIGPSLRLASFSGDAQARSVFLNIFSNINETLKKVKIEFFSLINPPWKISDSELKGVFLELKKLVGLKYRRINYRMLRILV